MKKHIKIKYERVIESENKMTLMIISNTTYKHIKNTKKYRQSQEKIIKRIYELKRYEKEKYEKNE